MPSFEYLIENNHLRACVREIMEVKPLRAATGVGRLERALHIASGNGSATQLLVKHFAPEWLAGIDRDPEAIAAAQARHASEAQEYSVQSVESLGFADGSFDAVFDLADLHNLPAWRRGLAEIERVLAPGGLL
ncbi:MAG: class I SAM-dependent methyltransferase, partial [Spirochaetaceae bacterium]|nr:class I SAM-dependent methyltransferase [Spirochaetaceae bacterium]